MNTPTLEREYPLLLNDIGPDGRLRGYKIFDYLQDIAACHAARLGFGIPQLKELGIIWVLSRIKLEMDEWPEIGDSVRVTTWPSGLSRLFATRQYEIVSTASGRTLGRASSFWLTLDLQTLRPVNPAGMLNGPFPSAPERPVFFPELGKLPSGAGENPMSVFAEGARIDYNDHMNNAYYAQFTQDWLARRCGKMIRFRSIQLNFNLSVRFGESFVVDGTADGSRFAVAGTTSEGKNVFQAAGEYFLC